MSFAYNRIYSIKLCTIVQFSMSNNEFEDLVKTTKRELKRNAKRKVK